MLSVCCLLCWCLSACSGFNLAPLNFRRERHFDFQIDRKLSPRTYRASCEARRKRVVFPEPDTFFEVPIFLLSFPRSFKELGKDIFRKIFWPEKLKICPSFIFKISNFYLIFLTIFQALSIFLLRCFCVISHSLMSG